MCPSVTTADRRRMVARRGSLGSIEAEGNHLLFADLAVAVPHVAVGRMAARHGCDPVPARFGAGDPPVAVVVGRHPHPLPQRPAAQVGPNGEARGLGSLPQLCLLGLRHPPRRPCVSAVPTRLAVASPCSPSPPFKGSRSPCFQRLDQRLPPLDRRAALPHSKKPCNESHKEIQIYLLIDTARPFGPSTRPEPPLFPHKQPSLRIGPQQSRARSGEADP